MCNSRIYIYIYIFFFFEKNSRINKCGTREEKTRIRKVLGFFLSFLHVLNIWNGNVALNVSLVDVILVVLTISLTIFPLFYYYYFFYTRVYIYIYIYKIAVNLKRYTGIDWYPKYIVPVGKSVQPPIRY